MENKQIEIDGIKYKVIERPKHSRFLCDGCAFENKKCFLNDRIPYCQGIIFIEVRKKLKK